MARVERPFQQPNSTTLLLVDACMASQTNSSGAIQPWIASAFVMSTIRDPQTQADTTVKMSQVLAPVLWMSTAIASPGLTVQLESPVQPEIWVSLAGKISYQA